MIYFLYRSLYALFMLLLAEMNLLLSFNHLKCVIYYGLYTVISNYLYPSYSMLYPVLIDV